MPDGELLAWLEQQARKDSNGCWNWSKRLNKDGYGQTSYQGKTVFVHRLMFTMVNGHPAHNQLVMHTCDNRQCFNPKHLKAGDAAANMKDSYKSKPYSNRTIQRKEAYKEKLSLTSPEDAIQIIKRRCQITGGDCWLYPLYRTESYAMITISGQTYRVHRLVLSLKLGKDYQEVLISRHLCHVKNCCNPNHLEEGTNSQNMLDSRKGKLTGDDVTSILLYCLSAEAQAISGDQLNAKFAALHGVSPATIQSVRNGDTWKDVYKNIVDKHQGKLRKRGLTEDNVREVLLYSISDEARSLYGKDIDDKFAKKFEVSSSTITQIRAGLHWKSVFDTIVKPEERYKLVKEHFRFGNTET